jgi:hypothetical protein
MPGHRIVVGERLIISERMIQGGIPDIIPSNAWFSDASGSGAISTNTVTVAGLDTGVSIDLSLTNTNSNGIPSWEVVSGSGTANSSTVTGVVNGSQLRINIFAVSPPQSGSISVFNDTDNGTFLDSFNWSIS